MDFEEKELQKIDIFVIVEDFLKEARSRIALLLILVVLGSGLLGASSYINYAPYYTATASFTVKVANPLYSGVSSYNTKTAEQMAKTFPYILTSGVLQERVKEHLGIEYVPSVTVSANSSSSIITMKVTDSDPQRAYDVLNAVITYYPEIAEFVVGSTVLVLLDESGVPAQPSNTRSVTGAIKKGALLGALIWTVIVVLMAISKNTIHNEDELKRVLNVPCIGQIPAVKVPNKTHCPLMHKNRRLPGFAESIRLLRLHVDKTMGEKQKKVLLVSSAIPGEGKTTVSVNLAISLAKKGNRVLVVDCDLRNPSVAKALRIQTKISLVDYIKGSALGSDIINTTDVEGLFFISGGSGSKNMTEQLSQEKVAVLIRNLRKQFDYVILDTPPCALLADAGEVAKLAECGLMVIRQDHAARDQIMARQGCLLFTSIQHFTGSSSLEIRQEKQKASKLKRKK